MLICQMGQIKMVLFFMLPLPTILPHRLLFKEAYENDRYRASIINAQKMIVQPLWKNVLGFFELNSYIKKNMSILCMQLVWSYYSWVQGFLDQNSTAVHLFCAHIKGQKKTSVFCYLYYCPCDLCGIMRGCHRPQRQWTFPRSPGLGSLRKKLAILPLEVTSVLLDVPHWVASYNFVDW